MTRTLRTLSVCLAMGFAIGSRAVAQDPARSAKELRDMIIEDSLTPAKKQLRGYVAELRDTLNAVQAIHARIVRTIRASNMNSVVLSDGRALAKRCRVGGAAADLASKRIAAMYTSDPHGDQALNTYRTGLVELMEQMRVCEHDDSLVMAAAPPDLSRIERVAAAADDAVTRYDAIRDALMKLLNITLPVKGKIYQGGS